MIRPYAIMVTVAIACVATSLTCRGADAKKRSRSSVATLEQLVEHLDLRAFPRLPDAQAPQQADIASLTYAAPGTVKAAYQQQLEELKKRKWSELPNGYVSDESASGTFAYDGFRVSVTVTPAADAGLVQVQLHHHGNIDLSKLPIPPRGKSLYSFPLTVATLVDEPVETAATWVREALLKEGWQPYGVAGDSQFFKQHAVRLLARVSSAPAQDGKTVIDYSSEAMSSDLPAPPSFGRLHYADTTRDIEFDTPLSTSEIVDFYRSTLAHDGWQATTENLVDSDFKQFMIFRQKPSNDMRTLELDEVDGRVTGHLRHQTAAEVAEEERLAKAEIERRRAMKSEKPNNAPRVTLDTPRGATNVESTNNSLACDLKAGKAKDLVIQWQKEFTKQGWKEETSTLDPMAGTIVLTKDDLTLTFVYVDTGFLPAHLDVTLLGGEFEHTTTPAQR